MKDTAIGAVNCLSNVFQRPQETEWGFMFYVIVKWKKIIEMLLRGKFQSVDQEAMQQKETEMFLWLNDDLGHERYIAETG